MSAEKTSQRIAVFGGSFNPPGLHHREIVERLSQEFDLVLVIPCGFRPDKAAAKQVSAEQRKEMIRLTFSEMEKVEVLYFDLEAGVFTPTFKLDEQLSSMYDGELWHAIGTDIIQGGANGRSEIHQLWYRGEDLWTKLNFAILNRSNVPACPADFPRKSLLVRFDNPGSSTEIRKRTADGEAIQHLVTPEVAEFIASENLYLVTN